MASRCGGSISSLASLDTIPAPGRPAVLLTLALLAVACGRGRSDASAAELTLADDSVAMTLEAPARVKAGTAVLFRLTLANITDRQLTLYLPGREISWDVKVTTGRGATIWRRLEESRFREILAVRPLGPRQKMVLESEWPAARPIGNYLATAQILTDGEPFTSSPVSFEVR